jgi:hypothetical protein
MMGLHMVAMQATTVLVPMARLALVHVPHQGTIA